MIIFLILLLLSLPSKSSRSQQCFHVSWRQGTVHRPKLAIDAEQVRPGPFHAMSYQNAPSRSSRGVSCLASTFLQSSTAWPLAVKVRATTRYRQPRPAASCQSLLDGGEFLLVTKNRVHLSYSHSVSCSCSAHSISCGILLPESSISLSRPMLNREPRPVELSRFTRARNSRPSFSNSIDPY
jgi:hypothetical protein